jgi:hypothetical protein
LLLFRENRRHSRRLGWGAPVSGRQFPAFRSFGGGFRAPVSAGGFPISVSAVQRPVRLLTETGSRSAFRVWARRRCFHEPQPLSDMWRADATSWQYGRPAGVALSLHVSANKVEPTPSNRRFWPWRKLGEDRRPDTANNDVAFRQGFVKFVQANGCARSAHKEQVRQQGAVRPCRPAIDQPSG